MSRKNLYKEQVAIIREAHKRMVTGEKKYGIYKPRKCKRDLYEDMIEELLDFINYATMEIMKIKRLRERKERVVGEVEKIIKQNKMIGKQIRVVASRQNEIQQHFSKREPQAV